MNAYHDIDQSIAKNYNPSRFDSQANYVHRGRSMNSKPGRVKGLESALSMGLLAILGAIALAVLLKQSRIDVSRFGLVSTPSTISDEQDKPQGPLPNAIAPSGFQSTAPPRTYTERDLYEKINGKAPFYTEAGFLRLTTERFSAAEANDKSIELYLYDMADAKNAFSVYSRQKRLQVLPWRRVRFGYRTGNGLYFVHGRYYCELVGSSESAPMREAMTELGAKLIDSLAVDGDSEIPGLDLFASENLVTGSHKLYLNDAFGFEGLTDTLAARYKIGNDNVTAFVSRRQSPQDADKIAEGYAGFLVDTGGATRQNVSDGLLALNARVIDLYGVTEIVFTVGCFVAGVHEADDPMVAEKLAVSLAQRLSEAAERKTDE